MKIVIGVDTEGHYTHTVKLVERLKFPEPHWILAHSVDIVTPVPGYLVPTDAAFKLEFVKLANDAGQHALERAAEEAAEHATDAETVLLQGGPAGALEQYADEINADLIAVHSERKSRFSALFFGSVSRGLALESKQSILISKGESQSSEPISVVFATDHSDFAKKSLAAFLAMGAKGIKKITLVTALDVGAALDFVYPDTITAVETDIEEQMAAELIKVQAAGYEGATEIIQGPVSDAIHHAMKIGEADLLVMGARGHGFMHRLVLGSTALEQVVAEPYSVMIIRP